MKIKINLIFVLTFVSAKLMAQNGFYLQVGPTISSTKGDIGALITSFETYKERVNTTFNDDIKSSENFKKKQIATNIGIEVGFRGEGLMLGFIYQPNNITQDAIAMQNSGFGRRFYWAEKRNEMMLDLGWSNKRFSAFGSFGLNNSKFTMASYQMYRDGTESIGNEYSFNGLFRQEDVGLNYGLGLKFYPIKFVSLGLRYFHSGAKLIGESDAGAELTLTDNSLSRATNGDTEFPADWTNQFGFQNNIPANFSRNYIQLSLAFDLFYEGK